MHIIKSLYPEPPPTPETNAHNLLLRRPDQAQWPDFPFLIDASSGEKRSFTEFRAQVQDLATALAAPVSKGGLGLHRGDEGEMVGIISENSMDFITLIQACVMLTTPFAAISFYSTPFELKHALNLSKVTRLFVDPKFLNVILPVAKEINLPTSAIYLLNTRESKGHKSISDLVEDVHNGRISVPPVLPRQAGKDTLMFLIFSSGTSGLPKAVMISHGNMNAYVSQGAVMAKVAEEVYKRNPPPPQPAGIPVSLAFLPIHHTYGLNAYCFRPMFTPTTLVIMSKWNIDAALNLISKYRVTNLALIPSVIHQLVNHPKIHQADLSSVTSIASGAAYLPPELAEKMGRLTKNGTIVAEGYGMSEMTVPPIVQPIPGSLSGKLKVVRGSTGVLLPGIVARIVRDDGSDANINEPGELWLKSPNVALGYYNNEKATKETFVDGGWLRTGDRFRMDEDGNFFFADRAKDTLKVSGTQVSPVEIENVLSAHPKGLIKDVTVAGVSGHGRTSDEKVPRAWIVLSDNGKKIGAKKVVDELEKWHQKNLSKYKWLRGGIEIVDEIPKSPTGKVLRRVLQDKYEQGVNKLRKAKL